MTGAHQGERLALGEDALDQQFNLAAARLVAEEPRFHDPGVVEHERVAPVDQAGQVGERQIADRAGRGV